MVTPVKAQAQIMKPAGPGRVHDAIGSSNCARKVDRRLFVCKKVSNKANTAKNVQVFFERNEFERGFLSVELQFQCFHFKPSMLNCVGLQNLLSYWFG